MIVILSGISEGKRLFPWLGVQRDMPPAPAGGYLRVSDYVVQSVLALVPLPGTNRRCNLRRRVLRLVFEGHGKPLVSAARVSASDLLSFSPTDSTIS